MSAPEIVKPTTLANRALKLALLRIGLVSLVAGAVSYTVNLKDIESAVTRQLQLSTEQTLQRESLPFQEIKDLQKNFLAEFKDIDTRPDAHAALVKDFGLIFLQHPDGSYTQRPGLFEGQPLPDGRRFANMSATYAPDIPPNDDTKARFALSYQLSHKYGSSAKGRLFNFYGVVPEKGFPIHQAVDIAREFSYSGPDALNLNNFEFYTRGFGSPSHETFFTQMYWDPSNKAWMTTVATPDEATAAGKHRILACVDVLLDELMLRTARPSIQGAYSTLFMNDADGTLLYHPAHVDDIQTSEGKASIRSLSITNDYPLLAALPQVKAGQATVVQTDSDIVAQGIIPGTPWVLAVHYPRQLMNTAILTNLAIVVALGLLTLLVEVFILRSILQKQVAIPLSRLIAATRQLGMSRERMSPELLPTQSSDEVGQLAREFACMTARIQEAQSQLELKVQERTSALEDANRQLVALSATDTLTGLFNRRHFDEALQQEWQRALRTGNPLAVMMIDVDWFKRYNDRYGHLAGDDCLCAIAQTLKAHACRAGDVIARYGGEEFVVVCTPQNPVDAMALAHKLCSAVSARQWPHDISPVGHVTISIGVAVTLPNTNHTAAELVKRADDALYQAKAQGRNQVVLATDPPQKTTS
ncbi:MAG TPA: diguanylate cyclase [Burkholderiaceae bacterium]|nr:diguanylate cyclase [Burkholderiaceae bacterium]